MTKDHVVPKSQGGEKTVPCCLRCNDLKGNLSIWVWRRFMDAYPDYWRSFRTHAEVRRAIRFNDERIFNESLSVRDHR